MKQDTINKTMKITSSSRMYKNHTSSYFGPLDEVDVPERDSLALQRSPYRESPSVSLL